MIDLSAHCVGHWKLNDNLANTNVVNEIGADGVLLGGGNTEDKSVEGKTGRALEFDGVDDYVDCGSAAAFNFGEGGDFSISMWFKLGSVGNKPVHLINKREDGGDYKGYWIFYEGRMAEGYYRRVIFQIDTGPLNAWVASSSYVNDGQWHHIAGVRESSTLRLFLDGVQEGGDSSGEGYDADLSNSKSLKIGSRQTPSMYFFPGRLDNVMIFDKALSGGEVGLLWNKGNGTESLQLGIARSLAGNRKGLA